MNNSHDEDLYIQPFPSPKHAVANLVMITRLLDDKRFESYFTSDFEKRLFAKTLGSVECLISYLKMKHKIGSKEKLP